MPPDDWSFEGIIFFMSGRGVHGLNSTVETPYVIAYGTQYRTFPQSGALSPDARWFAVPRGLATTSRYNVSLTWHYDIDEIIIYSTDARREIHSVPIDAFYLGTDISSSAVDPVQWISNSEFVYLGRHNIWVVNAFTGEQ
jgi:hypothetical protein